MDIVANKKSPLFVVILRILLILSGIQVIRLLLFSLIGNLGNACDWFLSSSDIANGLSILATAIVLWILIRPTPENLGFTPFVSHAKSKPIEICGVVLLVILAGINLVLNPDQIIPTVISCLVFPLFEEPIIRGWAWNTISSVLPARRNGLATIVFTTLLFALWHLGYWDVILLHTSPEILLRVMLMKMVIATIIGILAGILRWKTGNIYGSILIHAAWNLFGR